MGVRLDHAVVDTYDGALTPSKPVSATVEIPFIAIVNAANGAVAPGDGITSITAYVTDQAGNSASDQEELQDLTIEVGGDLQTDDGVLAPFGEGSGEGYSIAVKDDDGPIAATSNVVERSDETITLTATAIVGLGTTANPFADGVFFYAEVDDIETGLVHDATDGDPRTELRRIGMVAGSSFDLDTGLVSRKWTYETEVSADDFYAIVGRAGMFEIRALGVNGSGVAHFLTYNAMGETAVLLEIASRR